jgi:hypothetical protein
MNANRKHDRNNISESMTKNIKHLIENVESMARSLKAKSEDAHRTSMKVAFRGYLSRIDEFLKNHWQQLAVICLILLTSAILRSFLIDPEMGINISLNFAGEAFGMFITIVIIQKYIDRVNDIKDEQREKIIMNKLDEVEKHVNARSVKHYRSRTLDPSSGTTRRLKQRR